MMKVLVACEFSGIVRDSFLVRGHAAVSCDLLPSESPAGPHFCGDVFELLHWVSDRVSLPEVVFRRRGRTIIAQVEGVLFEPASGQMLLTEVEEAVERYLKESCERIEGVKGEEVRERLQLEAQEVRESLTVRVAPPRIEVRYG
jgi:hypothetical protein